MERRDAEAQSLFFLREQSTQRVAFVSVLFAFSLNYSSASLRLCVRFFRKPILFYYKKRSWEKFGLLDSFFFAIGWDEVQGDSEKLF